MKTFKQFISEKDYNWDGINHWGVIHPKGHLISGNEHPTASTHKELIAHHSSEKHPPHHFVHYASEGTSMNIYGPNHKINRKNVLNHIEHLTSGHKHTRVDLYSPPRVKKSVDFSKLKRNSKRTIEPFPINVYS